LASASNARRYLALAAGSLGGIWRSSGNRPLRDLYDTAEYVVQMIKRIGLVSSILKFFLARNADLLVDTEETVG
jgi:hypothetical protein